MQKRLDLLTVDDKRILLYYIIFKIRELAVLAIFTILPYAVEQEM